MKQQIIILAAGESSRFFPFNKLHKSFFRVAGKRIIERTLEDVLTLSPSKIVVVLSKDKFAEEEKILKENMLFSEVEFVAQNQALGQMDAILSAKDKISEDFFVINAQQFNLSKVANEFIKKHTSGNSLLTVGSSDTNEPSKYGMLKIEGEHVTQVIEKPEPGKEPSNKKLDGIYLFSYSALSILEKTKIWENSLEEAINNMAKDGNVSYVEIVDGSPTLKYPWDLFEIRNRIFKTTEWNISKKSIIEKTAVLKGDNIFVGDGAKICDYAIVEGPCYIGENALVGAYCQVRDGSVMENRSQIERYTDLKNSFVGENTHLHSGFVGDSIIGSNARIGAEFITANKRLDRGDIYVHVKDRKVNSSRNNLGVILGDNAKVGIRVSTMPGAIIGNDTKIYPAKIINGFVKNEEEVK